MGKLFKNTKWVHLLTIVNAAFVVAVAADFVAFAADFVAFAANNVRSVNNERTKGVCEPNSYTTQSGPMIPQIMYIYLQNMYRTHFFYDSNYSYYCNKDCFRGFSAYLIFS